MQTTVDARGMDCPIPVIKTKNALETILKGNVLTIVDNEIAKENIMKLAKGLNCNYKVVETEGEFFIDITKEINQTDVDIISNEIPSMFDTVVVVGSNRFGEGEHELGDILIRGYFYALSEMKTLPKAIIFLNSGVYLTAEDSKVIKNLRIMESSGVEIISCGTCLDYYNLKNKIGVGGSSNMYTIVELMNNCSKVIKL